MECLYEDEFVLLTPAKLVIKNFRFPSKKCKIVNMELISVLWFEVNLTDYLPNSSFSATREL